MAIWKYTTVAPSIDGFVTTEELETGLAATLLNAYNNIASALGLGILTAIPTDGSVTNTSLSNLFTLAQTQISGLATSLSNATANAISNITSALGGGTLTAVPTNNSVTLASLIGGFVLPQSNVSNLLSDLTTQLNFTKVVRDAVARQPNATDSQVQARAQYIGNLLGFCTTNMGGSITPGSGGKEMVFSYFLTEIGYTWGYQNSGTRVVLPATGTYLILGNANWGGNAVNANTATAIRVWAYNSSHAKIGELTSDVVTVAGGTQPVSASPSTIVEFNPGVLTLPGFAYAGVSLYLESTTVGAGRGVNNGSLTIIRVGDSS